MAMRIEANIYSEPGNNPGHLKLPVIGEVTHFSGKTKEYDIKTIKSGAFRAFVTGNELMGYEAVPDCKEVVETVDNLYRLVYPLRAKRNPELTTRRVLKSLSHPRTTLELILDEGEPVGYGVFPILDINGTPVLYSSRAILKEHTREGIGTHILEKVIESHKRASARTQKPLREGMLMTQKWESIRSLEELKMRGIIDKIQPFDEPYDQEGKRILFGVHSLMFVGSSGIEETGVSHAEVEEVGPNETATIPEEGSRGWQIQQKMVLHPPNGAGLNLQAGDMQYVRFTLHNPQL